MKSNIFQSVFNGLIALERPEKYNITFVTLLIKVPLIPLIELPSCSLCQAPSVKPVRSTFYHNGPLSFYLLQLSKKLTTRLTQQRFFKSLRVPPKLVFT